MTVIIRPFRFAFAIGFAAFAMAASLSASTITYNTNALGTGFGGVNLVLNSTGGVASTLTFIPNTGTVVGTPSNINFGNFTLVCPTCTTQALGTGSSFDPFTFDLVITDVTDGATGMFVGTSTGGNLYSDVSQLTVNWAPLQIGPGVSNALSGDFGTTVFSTTVFTGIVAPNSGAVPGQSTVQGYVDSAVVPEPETWGLVGASLIGLSMLSRRRLNKQ